MFSLEVSDVERTVKFWTELLGFSVSDRNEFGMVFLRTNCDHHTIAIAIAPGIAPVGLHFVADLAGDQRRRHHVATMPEPRQLPLNDIPTRARFIADVELLPVLRQSLAQSAQLIRRVGNRAVEPNIRPGRSVHQRNRDRLLVYIQANEKSNVRHGPPRSVSGDRLRPSEKPPQR